MIYILAFLLAIAILVVIHEYGHYWVARRCGVKVLRFSVGFGKVIYSKRFAGGDTEWVISSIPLGGYVKMVDEREGDVAPEDLPYAFNRQPVWKRMAIVVAGPLANLLLAIVLYWVMFVHGVYALKPIVGEVPAQSAAATAQMQAGETIVTIEGKPIASWQDVGWTLLNQALKQDSVVIETRNSAGTLASYQLNISQLQGDDLGSEFLDKLGLKLQEPATPPIIGRFGDNSAGEAAGLKVGDRIRSIDGQAINDWSQLVNIVRQSAGKPLLFELAREAEVVKVTVTPQAERDGEKTIGKIGCGPQMDQVVMDQMFVQLSYGPLSAMQLALEKTWETSIVSLKMMWKMVMGEVSLKNLSGPITIADYAGQSAQNGLATYIGFLALISISIGIFNLLPIPMLDGGHLLFYCVEVVKGSPVSEQAWLLGQKIGMALLGLLMVCAIYNDINRLV